MNWSGFFMALYLAIGSLVAIGMLFSRILVGRIPDLYPMGATIASLTEGQRARIGRTRMLALTLLSDLPNVVTWPASYLAFRRRRNLRRIIILRIRWPLDVIESVWLLLISALIAILIQVSGSDLYLRIACYAIIVATIFIPARWIINGDNLRREMRRTLRSPIAQFSLIAATNFIALSIAAAVLLQVSARSPFRWESVWPEARQIWAFGSLLAILRARPTGATEIVVAGAGLAVYALLLSQLITPWRFRRTGGDRIEISTRLLLINDNDGAKHWLKSVRTDDPKLLPDLVKAEGMLALRTGDFSLALQRAQVMASLRRLPAWPEDKNDGRRILAKWAEFFIRVDYGELFSRVVSYLIGDGISDPCLATIVPTLVFFEIGEERHGRMARWMEQGMEQERHQAEAAENLNANLETFTHELSAGMTDPPYTLTLAMIEAWRNQSREAAARLLRMPRTRRVPNRVVKRILAGHVIVEAVVQEGNLSQIRKAWVEDILGLLNEAQEWSIEEFPLWLREWVQDDIKQHLRGRFFWEDKEIASALQELDRFLAGRSDITEVISKTPHPADFTYRKGTADITRALTAVSLRDPPSTNPNECRIFDGPVKAHTPDPLPGPRLRTAGHNVPYHAFLYCVRCGRRGRHRDIYVWIHKDAPKSIIATEGRAFLEETLSRGKTPPRIIIDSSGKNVGSHFSSAVGHS